MPLAAALALLLLAAAPARAVLPEPAPPAADAEDRDYAAALAAWHLMDWERMIARLGIVLAGRPDHADALTLMGYGYRQLGQYDRALLHYGRALARAPDHRGALAYQGVTFLHIGALDRAQANLARLAALCGGADACLEARELAAAIAAYRATGAVPERCPSLDHPLG